MKTRPLFCHILYPFLALSLLAIAAVTLIAVGGLRSHSLRHVEADLASRAVLLKPHLLQQPDAESLQAQSVALANAPDLKQLKSRSGSRFAKVLSQF